MAEQLTKLRPDRDLQCYFERPSAMAALSGASADGFTVSGCWRQQFDWVVIEWNRDNVFEHPALRNLPDGDLSGLQLSYEEVRTNCIPLDSTLYPTVDWPYLRIWAEAGGVETLYKVPLKDYATALGAVCGRDSGIRVAGNADGGRLHRTGLAGSTLQLPPDRRRHTGERGQRAGGCDHGESGGGRGERDCERRADRADLSWRAGLEWKPDRRVRDGARSGDGIMVASARRSLRVEYRRSDGEWNSISPRCAMRRARLVPTTNVRKMRWTWAADLQSGNFERSEFAVAVTNWQVSGTNLCIPLPEPGAGGSRMMPR